MFWAACTLAYFGFLHSAEFTVPNLASFSTLDSMMLQWIPHHLHHGYGFTSRPQKQIYFARAVFFTLAGVSTHFMLQRVQNAAARLVNNTLRICHITPILEDLHWLPIKYRIEFKIVLLTFKCLYGLAPQYLVDLIAVAPQSRYNLRSRNATLLVSAKARCLPTLGD